VIQALEWRPGGELMTYRRSFVPELTRGRTALIAGLASIWNLGSEERPGDEHDVR
jgi:hypothetical protein